MTTGPRLAAAAAAGVLALLTVAPSAQAAPPTVEWTRPSTTVNKLEEPGPLTVTVTKDQEQQTIDKVGFELTPDTPPEDPCFVDLGDQTVQMFTSDTASQRFELDIDFPCNRAYKIAATVFYADTPLGVSLSAEEKTPPVPFSLAIPPAQVKGLSAVFDEATREVRLEWAPNPEPDLIRYIVERNPAGRDPFTGIGEVSKGSPATFIDPDVGEEFIYRVTAVREGPDGPIIGEPSVRRMAGPEAPEPTRSPPTPSPAPSGNTGGSGGNQSTRPRPPSRQAPGNNTFEQALPFDPSRTTTTSPESSSTPPEDAAVLAEFDDDPADADQQRGTLVPVAGGLALLVGSLHLFLLSRRAGENDIPIVPR